MINTSCSLDTPRSFARTPRLARMRSQRIVHVMQSEKSNDISVVTMSEDGHTEEVQETLNFPTPSKENIEEPVILEDYEDEQDGKSPAESIVFEIDFGNGEFQQHVWHKDEDQPEATRVRKASLFSDDEFEPIRMKLPKRRPPMLLRLPNDKVEKPEVQVSPPPCDSPTPSLTSDDSGHSGSSKSTSLDHPQGLSPSTALSSPTLFSVDSASSSSTYLDATTNLKSPGQDQTFRAYDKDLNSTKFIGIVTPDSVAETRGLVDLRAYGYDFGWSRFTGRSDGPHGLSPEDSADLEMFLSRGLNKFPRTGSCKPTAKKSGLEKRLREVFKLKLVK